MDYRTITKIPIVRTHDNAILPKQSSGDVGFDLHSVENVRLYSGEVRRVHTGLRLAGPIKHPGANTGILTLFLKIEGRSGLASDGIFPIGGIIDPDYRGAIDVILHSVNPRPHNISIGDRIAQLVVYAASGTNELHKTVMEEIKGHEIDETERGSKGFGSSGT
jgi:dUTP pyrophosphatase